MHYTTELLIQGNKEILEYYKSAINRWNLLLQDHDRITSEELARTLSIEQHWFEMNCGSRWVGQEIMVVTGIARDFTTKRGFKDKALALKVYRAFMQSYCSVEVKGIAEDVAKSYYLDEGGCYDD